MRQSISANERLAITLRFLASGDSYQSIAYLYRVSVPTLSHLIPDTCEAIYSLLKDRYLKVPSTEQEWMEITDEFQQRWQYPHCIGAIDGKHIAIQAPANTASQYHNYKQFFSIILMAVVDARYRFVVVDVGANGREWASMRCWRVCCVGNVSSPRKQ